jgi:hypothetical protein
VNYVVSPSSLNQNLKNIYKCSLLDFKNIYKCYLLDFVMHLFLRDLFIICVVDQ